LFKQTQEWFAAVVVVTAAQLRTPLRRLTLRRVPVGFHPSTQCRHETSAEG
jgi:hypothetical protein